MVASSSVLNSYRSTPIFYLLFTDYCLLVDKASSKNGVVFFKIIDLYCQAL